jgi:hypothetical protein
MTIETAPYINGLNSAYPEASSDRSAADDHLRLIKAAVKNSFPAILGAVTATHTELSYCTGLTETVGPTLQKFSLSISALNTQATALSATVATMAADLGRLSQTISVLRADVDAVMSGYVRCTTMTVAFLPTISVTQINSNAYAELTTWQFGFTSSGEEAYINVDAVAFTLTSTGGAVGQSLLATIPIPPGGKYWWGRNGATVTISMFVKYST